MKKKNLVRAITLGLLLGGAFAGSAWAADIVETNKEYNSANLKADNIILTYDNEFTGTSPIWIKGTVNATDTFKIVNTKDDSTKGKGINSYNGKVDITAKNIIIETRDDGIFTTKNTGGEGPIDGDDADITLSGFDNLEITSSKGFGIVNNGNKYGSWLSTKGGSDINIIGNQGSVITITGGYNEDEYLSKAAITNTTNTATNVSGGNINLNGSKYVISAYGKSIINIEAEDKNTLVGKDTGIYSTNGSTVTIKGAENSISAGGNALYAYSKGTISIVSNGELNITNISGDILSNGGTIIAGFDTEKSSLYGKVTTKNSYSSEGTTNLNFADSASWTMTGNSNVTNLGIDNAFVDMTANDKGNAHALTVDKTQTGSGTTFAIDLDAANKNNKAESATSDYIYLNGSSEGTHYIAFDVEASKLATDMSVGDKLFFAYVNNDKDGESAEFATAGGIDLEKASAENIYNYKFGVDKEENTDKTGNDWYIGLTDKNENENITTVDDMMGSGYALGTELDRLNKRMGESRYLTDEKGLWVRYRHARVGMDNSFKTNSNMFQLGYDKERLEKDGRHYRGGALDYTDANTSLSAGGSGEQERYSLSLYDTWMGDKGHYRDLVIRGGRINSEFDVNARSNETINSDYHQWFGSISGEWGRKKDTGNDWYFEPQTQLQIARVGSADYMTNYGVRVEQDAATSVIGRVGFRLGREYDKDDATKRDNYYIKADVLHEFCGDQGFTVTGADGSLSKEYDGKDTWFDVGVGADITISRDTYFWVDVERTLGGDFDRTWQINGGFRWEFK